MFHLATKCKITGEIEYCTDFYGNKTTWETKEKVQEQIKYFTLTAGWIAGKPKNFEWVIIKAS